MKFGNTLAILGISLLIASCDDNMDNIRYAEGGITGSGISVGPITGFGSIWQGGVRYDVSQAAFIRNGEVSPLGQDSFQVGEIVSIEGDVNPDGITGIATKVIFDRNLSGMLSSVSPDGHSIKVLGQTVEIDALTLFLGFSTLDELETGNILEISGARNAEGTFVASTINLTNATYQDGFTELEVEGHISAINTQNLTFKINDLTIDYGQAILNGLIDLSQADQGIHVEVQSHLYTAGRLYAGLITLKDDTPQLTTNNHNRLEGRVTSYNNSESFSINGQEVTLGSDTVFENGSVEELSLDAHITVSGYIDNSGTLQAETISVRQSHDQTSNTKLSGYLSWINPDQQTVELLGKQVTVDSSTIILDHSTGMVEAIGFDDLRAYDHTAVTARLRPNGELQALRIDRSPPE